MLHKGGAQKVMAANYLSKSRHGTTYFFKRRIPRNIFSSCKQNLAITSKSVLTISLRTSDLKEARIRARWLAVQSDWLFQRLKQGDYMLEKKIEAEGFRFNYGLRCEFDDETRVMKAFTIDTEPGNQGDYVAGQAALEAILGAPASAPKRLVGQGKATSGPNLKEGAEDYLSEIAVKLSTKRAYRSKIDHLISFFSAEKAVLDVDQMALVEYSKWAKKDIPNANTSNQYVKGASTFLNWVRVRCGHSALTTRTLTQKRVFAPYKDRDCFSMDQMKVMFAHAMQYRESCPAKYWIILIMAFTGARLEEICQINLKHDLKSSRDGIWYFDLNERPEDDGFSKKSLKKVSTERVVAIHSALIERGFIGYLNAEIAKGFIRPFESCWPPLINREAGDYKWNHHVSKWGSKQMRLIRSKFSDKASKATFFHSMRHTFSTILANNGVSEEIRSAIQGQVAGSGVNGGTYTKSRLDPAQSSKVIEQHLTQYVDMLVELEVATQV